MSMIFSICPCHLYVGKIQFTLSDIVTPDGIIGHHKVGRSLIRFGSIPYQDLFRLVYQLITHICLLQGLISIGIGVYQLHVGCHMV
jgi:hypothetical protein